jgi:hypothetical protein
MNGNKLFLTTEYRREIREGKISFLISQNIPQTPFITPPYHDPRYPAHLLLVEGPSARIQLPKASTEARRTTHVVPELGVILSRNATIFLFVFIIGSSHFVLFTKRIIIGSRWIIYTCTFV